MPPTALALAIDDILRSTIVPSLKPRHFRKSGRHWAAETATSVRVVDVYASLANDAVRGRFQVLFGFAYPSLGEPRPERLRAPECAHFNPFVMPAAGRWTIEDATSDDSVGACRTAFAAAWELELEPYLDACDDPRAYRDRLMASDSHKSLLEAAALSERLGDEGERGAAVDRALDTLRVDDSVDEGLALWYAEVADELGRLDRRLESIDRDRAVNALERCRRLDDGGRLEIATDRHADALLRLARRLGVDVRAAIASGRARWDQRLTS
jgi:hypothetical protein